jgi:HPt (histidine-containing phosphotransfer) domain-containing protein
MSTPDRDMNRKADLDAEALERLRGLGGPQFVCEMIDIFLEYVPEKIAEASAGLQAGDLEAVRLAAHPIKSSAGNLGALALRDLAARIEQLAREQKGETMPALLHDLQEMYAEAERCLAAKRRELDTSSDPVSAPPTDDH